MITLIVGIPDSGKSLLAENIAEKLSGNSSKYYIATMVPFGEEGKKRVKKHQKMREGKGFITLEWPDDISERLDGSIDFSHSTVLLECMSNLVGNELYSEKNAHASDEFLVGKIIDAMQKLNDLAENLIIVTNEFALEDEQYDEATKRYVNLIATVNKSLMNLADVTHIHRNGEWTSNEVN